MCRRFQADILIVGGQPATPGLLRWLTEGHRGKALLLSVCTGAFHLADAGLLDGRRATTHHDFWDRFELAYPSVVLARGPRFVRCANNIFTAGGLTAGIDLALHIVGTVVGSDFAARTAHYLEYRRTLEMRSHCERCGLILEHESDARICSYECTFCVSCATTIGTCLNCGGELAVRPKRTKSVE